MITADEAREIAAKATAALPEKSLNDAMDIINASALFGYDRALLTSDHLVITDNLKSFGFKVFVLRGIYRKRFFGKPVFERFRFPSVYASWGSYDFGEGWEEL